MKNLMVLLLFLISISASVHAQIDQSNAAMVPFTSMDTTAMYAMSDAYASYENGPKYYLKGSKIPFSGFLYAKYDNGEFESIQQYENGIGNGIWMNYDPDGRKECQGTYVNNRVEGSVTFYYEDGSIKSQGQYRDYKKPIGRWTFYDRKGNVVSKRWYTP